MARRTVIDVKTLLDNSGLRSGATEAEGILGGLGGKVAAGAAVATAAVAAFGVTSVQSAMAFESQMGQVFTLLPGITEDAMGSMTDQVLAFTRQMGVLPDEVVPALYQALSSGIPQGNVFEFMEVAARASIGGNLEMVETVDLLSTAVNAYAEAGLSAEEASDIFFTTVRLGKTTIPELSAAFSNVGPIAASLGVGLDDVGAALATLTLSGVPTAQATTQLRAALSELGKSGTTASTIFEEMAGQTFTEFMEQGGNLGDALMTMASSGEPVIEMFSSIEAAGAVMSLVAAGGDRMTDATIAMGTASGATGAAFETMEGTSARSWDRIKAHLAAFQVQVGNELLPVVERVLDWFVEHWPQIQATIQAGVDWFRDNALPVLRSVFEAVWTAAETVVDWFQEHWPQIQEVITTVVEEISDLVEEHWPQIRDFIVDAVEAVQEGIELFVDFVSDLWERWGEDILAYARAAWGNIEAAIGGALDIIQGVFRAFASLFRGDWQGLWDAVKQILDGAATIVVAAISNLWAAVKLATSVAWDLIKTEVWAAIRALPGIIAQGHVLLIQAGADLIGKAKDGIAQGFVLIGSLIWDEISGLPETIRNAAGDLFGVGLDLFTRLKDGLIAGLVGIADAIASAVLGPLDAIVRKVAEIIGAVTGAKISATGSVGGFGSAPPVDPNKAQEDALLSHIRGVGGGTAQIKHGGGFVMPDWSTGTIVGTNEALVVAEVGEEVIPVGGRRGGGGPFIGVVNVLERRTIAEELEVAWLMHGARMN